MVRTVNGAVRHHIGGYHHEVRPGPRSRKRTPGAIVMVVRFLSIISSFPKGRMSAWDDGRIRDRGRARIAPQRKHCRCPDDGPQLSICAPTTNRRRRALGDHIVGRESME
jgi:hypothetical protein